MAGYLEGEIPIIVRGDGCYLNDTNGKRYLDALAGLFSDQHGLRLQRGGRTGRRVRPRIVAILAACSKRHGRSWYVGARR
ncbi:MAG TPA: hypothetical protein VJL85_00890 [Gaiellaceae bacterium]|jgi:hypothetical protein|nr:hypothetical protein [Gaiellaceae bacterium]